MNREGQKRWINMGMLPRFRVLHYFLSQNARQKYVAHCLDFDIVATADTCQEAERRLDSLVKFHIETFLKTSGVSELHESAPKRFWRDYSESLQHGGALPSSTLTIELPKVVPMANPYGEVEVLLAKAA